MNKKEKKMAIYGPYPPPIGGISVHIERMEHYIKDAGIPYLLFNQGYFSKKNVVATKKSPFFYLKILFNKEFNVFHFHFIFYLEFVFYFIFSWVNKTPLLLTFHGETLLNYTSWKKSFAVFLLRNTKGLKIISVSKNLNLFFNKQNLNTTFLPAYVPPKEVNFITITKDHRIHFVFSVWKFNKKLATEIYNVPLAFEFLRKNKNKFKMLLMIGSKEISDHTYLNKMIKEYDIEDSIILLYDKNIIDYVQNCSFLLRTNSVDGYGVSLQEAMDLGVPAISTNVCKRPEGTILFENNNLEDLTNKIAYVLKEDTKMILSKKEELDFHLKLISIYKGFF